MSSLRITADLREAIEDWVNLLREELPGKNAQALLAQALRSSVVAQEINEQIDWLVDHAGGEEAA